MMSAATRHHLARCAWAMLVAALLVAGAAWGYRAFQARALVERLRAAEIAHVPAIIRELGPFRSGWPRASSMPSRAMPHGPARSDFMPRWRSSTGTAPMRNRSSRPCWKGAPTRSASSARNWAPTVGMSWTRCGGRRAIRRRSRARRLRAACALAGLDPAAPQWHEIAPRIVDALLAEDWFLGPRWVDLLRPASRALIPPLSDLARSADDRDDRRARATRIFLEYAAAEPEWLADLVGDADARQFAELLPRLALASNRDRAIVRLRAAAAPAPDDATTDDSRPGPRDMAARRRARRAAALFRLGAPETAWGLLGSAGDPRVQAETIHALAECDAEPGPLVARLGEEADPAARRGLLLALGDLAPRIPEAVRQGARPAPGRRVPRRARPGHPRRVAATPPRPRPGPIRRAGRPFPGRRGRGRPGGDGSSTRGTPWSSSTRGAPIPANRSIACLPSPIAKSPWSNTGGSARTTTPGRT